MNIGNAIAIVVFTVACCASSIVGADEPGAYLKRAPFVHPKIIEDLTAWVSDSGEQVVAINLDESQNTDRYYGDVQVVGEVTPFVFYENRDDCATGGCPMGPPSFGYRVVGNTEAGIYVLFTEWSGGGTGRFRRLLFVSIEQDEGFATFSPDTTVLQLDRNRWLIKRLGDIPLGDRYQGEIVLNGNRLKIGKDEYPHSAGLFPEDISIEIRP